jgi:hypothetical protein
MDYVFSATLAVVCACIAAVFIMFTVKIVHSVWLSLK